MKEKTIPFEFTKCTICFKLVKDIDYHHDVYHSVTSLHQCRKCLFKTKRKDNLLRHERCVHNMFNKQVGLKVSFLDTSQLEMIGNLPESSLSIHWTLFSGQGGQQREKHRVVHHVQVEHYQAAWVIVSGRCPNSYQVGSKTQEEDNGLSKKVELSTVQAPEKIIIIFLFFFILWMIISMIGTSAIVHWYR